MRLPSLFRMTAGLVCALTALSAAAQNLPAIPPSLDPGFWGRANQPCALTLTQTNTSVGGSSQPPEHTMQLKLYRDSPGRERTDGFYDNGQPMAITLRDPGKNTTTILYVMKKSALVLSVAPAVAPPPGKGWSVERLKPRAIAGFPAEGLRFTRTILTPNHGTGSVTVVEEDWISNEMGVVLEQTIDNPQSGKTTKTVTQLQKVEPDPALFVVPSDYSVQQMGKPAP